MRENRQYAWMFVIALAALGGCRHTPLTTPPSPPPGVGLTGRTEVPVHIKGSDKLQATPPSGVNKQSRLVFALDDLPTDFTVHFTSASPCVGVKDAGQTNDFPSAGHPGRASCDVIDTAHGRYDYCIYVPHQAAAAAKRFVQPSGYDVKDCVGCYVSVQ